MPNFSGVFDALFASVYATNEAIAAPIPGIAPIPVPIIEDLNKVSGLSFRGYVIAKTLI